MTELAHERWEELKKLAEGQHGYFTTQQALALGYSHPNQVYHVNQNNWKRVAQGTYRLPWYPDDFVSQMIYWCLWTKSRSGEIRGAVSHASALYYHGLASKQTSRLVLSVPPSFQKRAPRGILLHRTELSPADTQQNGFLRVTTPQRTIADLLPELREQGELGLVAGRALERGYLTADQATGLGWLTRAPAAPPDQPAESLIPVAVSPRPEATESGNPLPVRRISMSLERSSAPALHRRAQAGFTLVELLVVMAIISVLAGMLLPALEKTLNTARQIYCASNLKQTGVGFALYQGDAAGQMPYFILTRPSGTVGSWGECMLMRSWPSSIFPYHDNTDVYYCPGDANRAGRPATPAANIWYYTSFAYRYGLAYRAEVVEKKPLKVERFAFPSQQVFMYERSDYHASPRIGIYTHYTGPAKYVLLNAIYVDGHALGWKMPTYNIPNQNFDPGWFSFVNASDPKLGYD